MHDFPALEDPGQNSIWMKSSWMKINPEKNWSNATYWILDMTCRLDYCNGMFTGLKLLTFKKLKVVQNTVTCLLATLTSKSILC